MVIAEMSNENIGHYVCEVLVKDLKTKSYFDYLEQNGETYFWFEVAGTEFKMKKSLMIERFETVDLLTVYLYKKKK